VQVGAILDSPELLQLINGDEYKIRATAPGFLDSWFSAASDVTRESVLEMLGYQTRQDSGIWTETR
jgi:hypothetical protein